MRRGVAAVLALTFAALAAGADGARVTARVVDYGTCVRLAGTASASVAGITVERPWPANPRPYTSVTGRTWRVVDAPPATTDYVVRSRDGGVLARTTVRVRPRLTLVRAAARPLSLELTVGAGRSLPRAAVQVERLSGGRWRRDRTLRLGSRLTVRFAAPGRSPLRIRVANPGAGYVPTVSSTVVPQRARVAVAVRRAAGSGLSEVVGKLRAAGLPTCHTTTANPELFGVHGEVYVNPGGAEEMFEFATARDATDASKRVSRDGSQVTLPGGGTLVRDVFAPERWFRVGRVLVHDVGANPTSLQAFRAVLGRPFAGR